MADQIYSMCWPPPGGSSQYQSESEQHPLPHPRTSIAPGNALESNSHDNVPMSTESHPSTSQENNIKRPGYCVNGKPISLSHLEQHGLEVEVPSGMVLAGAKSPILGKIILVTAVNKRFLPCDTTTPTVLGFSGCCVGCGDVHFRYFTEFATHINLLLATQPKKQKHLKFYIVRDNLGRLCRGPRILWRGVSDTPRKRTFPYPPGFQSVMENIASSHKITDVSSTTYPSMVGGSHSIREGRSSTSSQSSCDSSSSFDPSATPPVFKRSRDDLEGKNEDMFPPHAWLETVCGVRPVLILGYPNTPPHFISSYKEIILSNMLLDCFEFLKRPVSTNRNQSRPFQSPAHSSHQTRGTFSHPADIRTAGSPSSGFTLPQLSANVVIILVAQYLSTLPENATICKNQIHHLIQNSKELFWQTHQENSTIQPFFLTIDSTNLVHFTSVATLPSKGSVKLVSSVLSLNDAISKGLGFLYQISKHNQHRETKLQVPHYLLLVSSPPAQSPEFCILVTGVNQSKFLQERLINEQSSLLTSVQLEDCVSSLNRAYQMVNAAIDNLMKQVEQSMAKTKLVFLPFNGSSILKATENEAACMVPIISLGNSYQASEYALHAPQVASAHHLLSCVLTSKDGAPSYDLRHFSSVEFTVVIPPSQTYFHQILHQVDKSNVLVELGLSPPTQSNDAGFSPEHVIQNDGSEETKQRMKHFLTSAKSCQDVLFVLVCDEAHRYFTPEVATSLPSFQELSRLPNTLIILVTPVPYMFETCQSRIRPDNEVFWSDPGHFVGPVSMSDQNLLKNEDNLVHFGMPEYIETLCWTHQIPLIREDDEFECMVLRANVLSTVPSYIVRCYVLIHHYTTAIMWSAGMRSIEPHCTFKTLQVVRDIIECPLLSTSGRGPMLIIRIPNHVLSSWAYRKLKDTRDRVGFQYRFAIIYDDGESQLEMEDHFLRRLRVWRNGKGGGNATNADWHPTCYEDLLDLPSIVVVSGKERNGDTFPRSLKYCDFRLLDEHCSYRSSLELEFNAVSRYINSGLGTSSHSNMKSSHSANHGDQARDVCDTESDTRSQFCSSYPLPVLLVSRAAYSTLKKDFFGCPKNLSLGPDPATAWNNNQRPALVSGLPSEQSKYYRRWTKPRENFSRMGKDKTFLDTSPMKFYPACFLFSGPPQVGKMSAVLHFIQLLHNTLQKLQRVDVYNEVPECLADSEEIPASEMDQPSYKILSKVPFNSTLVGARFSSVSPIHRNTKKSKASDSKLTNGDASAGKRGSNNNLTNDVSGPDVMAKDVPTSSVMMSSFAAYDSYHHCDDCKNYREGLGPSLFTKHVFTLGTGEQLTFVIPSTRREWFTFNDQNELQTLKLPIVTRKSNSERWDCVGRHSEHALKSPIFMASIGRVEQGLLNLYHAMEGREGIHVTFVKHSEMPLYQKAWSNHVVVALPPNCNYEGLGMIKDIMKEFATQNLINERQRQQIGNTSSSILWPLVHIMDDSCVMWQNLSVDDLSSFEEDDLCKPGDWSLLRAMQVVELSPNITSFSIIGFNQWGTGIETKYKLNSYSVCHVYSSLFLNISTTHHVTYNRRLFSWEQVDFNLKLSAHGGVILRYNHMNVLTKCIPTGGGRRYDVSLHIEDIVSVPDREPGHLIPIPAHYLLEEYLRLKSAQNVFPSANQNVPNPVLLLDCFIDLGPSLTVEYRTSSCSNREEPGSSRYGGLLLYLCNGCHVTKERLRSFQFCPGAKICVISSDRSSLRDNVVKLDLEEHWRFRLRDEFKTAGSLGDGALYFLTGTYDG